MTKIKLQDQLFILSSAQFIVGQLDAQYPALRYCRHLLFSYSKLVLWLVS